MKFLSPEVALYLYKSTIRQVWNTVVTSGLVPLFLKLKKYFFNAITQRSHRRKNVAIQECFPENLPL